MINGDNKISANIKNDPLNLEIKKEKTKINEKAKIIENIQEFAIHGIQNSSESLV